MPLAPFPDGWYVVALSDELAPGRLVTRTFLGRDVVAWRTRDGAPVVQDAYCPHLGAHLGDGCLEADTVRCPFHAFRFDGSGACVATGYGTKPPPKARLETLPVREIAGAVLAYRDAEGRAPTWEPPPVDFTGWLPPLFHAFTFRGHPQETSENSVDLGHLAVVHGYLDVKPLGDVVVDGPYLNSRFSFERPRALFAGGAARLRTRVNVHVHGLGWSFVEARMDDLGLETRQLVLATPVDGERIVLRIGISVRMERPAKLHPALALLPSEMATRLVRRLSLAAYVADVEQDLPIWRRKIHIARPALADGDGPIGIYRRWARQFDPAARASTAQAATVK